MFSLLLKRKSVTAAQKRNTRRMEMSVSSQAHQKTEQVSEKVHEAIDKTADTINHATEKMHKGAYCAQQKSEEMVHTITEYVHKHPMTALGIAFVAGSILSCMMRRH